MADKVGTVFCETDYSKFRMLNGNRKISERRVKQIGMSIDNVGYVMNPIVVNELFEIIDGQGRFMALKERGLPIQYVVAEGARVEECRALNMQQSNWKVEDFIESYKDEGLLPYQWMSALIKSSGLRTSCVLAVLRILGATGLSVQSIMEGKLDIGINEYEQAGRILSFIRECIDALTYDRFRMLGRIENCCSMITLLYLYPDIDNKMLLKQMEKHRARILEQLSTKDQTAYKLDELYNQRNQNKVYFAGRLIKDHGRRKND